MKKQPVVQRHHISYDPEIIVPIFKGEHFILTLLQWRKWHSKGFCRALRDWLKEHSKHAVKAIPRAKKGHCRGKKRCKK